MRKLVFLALLWAMPAAAQDISGLWATQPSPKTHAVLHVELAPCGANICGTIRAAINTRTPGLVGRQILYDMAPQGDGRWAGGKMWLPPLDTNVTASLTLRGEALAVRACMLLLCRTQLWHRVP
jgi:uncharacterized protein (DUF2147 family)